MAVAHIRKPVTAEARFRIQAILCKIHDTLFPLSVSIHLCPILIFHSYYMDAAQFK